MPLSHLSSPQLYDQWCCGYSRALRCPRAPAAIPCALHWQDLEFAAEVRYYNVEKCRKLLQGLLEQYNFYTFEKEEDWTTDQRSEYSQQAATALQTFRTLFCGWTEFGSQTVAESQLSYSYSNDRLQALLNKMIVWCKESFASHPQEDGAAFTRCTAKTASELRSQTDPLTAPFHSLDKPSLWPLVEFVHIGVPSSRILKYATLVDLPGRVCHLDTLNSQH
jgi:hypothetical protein